MAKVKRVTSNGQFYGWSFKCPGCGDRHTLPTEGSCAKTEARWGFNGDVNKPVFTPSLNATCGHFVPGYEKEHCWCTYNKEQAELGQPLAPFVCYRCHSFIGCNGAEPGQIIFLGDCTHANANKVMDLPDLEDGDD
jgi:hypothetical protein